MNKCIFIHYYIITVSLVIVHLMCTCFFITKCKLFSMFLCRFWLLQGDMFTLKKLIKCLAMPIVVPLYSQPKNSNSIHPNLTKIHKISSLLPFGQTLNNLYRNIKSHIIKNTYLKPINHQISQIQLSKIHTKNQ